MNRSRKILITCHCVLNANAKVYPLASAGGVFTDAVSESIRDGIGLFQLPCPEVSYLGLDRWGMTRKQYDHPNFRNHCREILKYPMIQIEAFLKTGYRVVGLIGMDGSPNCGLNYTCEGYSGGEICSPERVAEQAHRLRRVAGKGIFMSIFLEGMASLGEHPEIKTVAEPMGSSQKP